MEDQEFINQLAEKLSKLGTVRPLGFHYLHPYGTVPADSIICNGATYSRALYKDFFDYITTQGWVKTEAEWQEIAERDNGFCPFYSEGDGSTNFRTPRFAPYQQIAVASVNAGTYHQAGLPNITGYWSTRGPELLGNTTGGALSIESTSDNYGYGHSSGAHSPKLKIDASRSSSVYGRSTTCQPESHEWIMCVVAYGIATNVGSVDMADVLAATAQVQAEINAVQAQVDMLPKPSAYVTETRSSGSNRYRVWSNGFIEQWGLLNGSGGGGTVTFPKQFSDTSYIFVVASNEEGTTGQWFGWSTSKKTTSSISSQIMGGANDGAPKQSWYAAGF